MGPLHRVRGWITGLSEQAGRLRYRWADLRRIPAREMAGDTNAGPDFSWLLQAGSTAAILACPARSTVVYELTLPAGARVVARCGLPRDATGDSIVEFEIRIASRAAERVSRVRVGGVRRGGRRSRVLRVEVAEEGPVRVTLRTLLVAGPAGTRAVWSNPRVETPRPIRDLMSALGSRSRWPMLRPGGARGSASSGNTRYRLWVRETEPSRRGLAEQRRWSQPRARTFTLITDARNLRALSMRTVACVLDQTYPHWEWLLVSEHPTRLAGAGRRDTRVRFVSVAAHAGRAAAWNAALQQAGGELAVLLDDGDTLGPAALYEVARAIDQTDAHVFYSDEDRSGPAGGRHSPQFKPDWSPELLLSGNYVGRLAAFHVGQARSAGGFRGEWPGAEEWDFWLRLSAARVRFRRIPRCLYHAQAVRPGPEPHHVQSLLERHCATIDRPAVVTTSAGLPHVAWHMPDEPPVSIIVPNRNAPGVLERLVEGILTGTRYPRRELVIVDNQSTDPATLRFYRALAERGMARIVPFDRPFNFSAACNAGAAAASGEMLLFLNNDIEVLS
ncbi:MAG TPA: glycosyltransferase, partial [Vicinamibacterales bacterium]|nr:glycosyltransferase [Vicinamibacterales bacterium]